MHHEGLGFGVCGLLGAIRLENVLLELRAFEVQHKLKPFKALIDKYIWFLGKQVNPKP